MNWRRFTFLAVMASVAMLVMLTGPEKAQAQNNGGIEVDAAGVLRMTIFRDPTGALMRRRLLEARATLAPELARPSK